MFTSPDLHFRAFTASDIDAYAGVAGNDAQLAEVDHGHTSYVVFHTTTMVGMMAMSHEGDLLWEAHCFNREDAAFLLNQMRFDSYRGSLGAHRYVLRLLVLQGWVKIY